jgi:hypothetical protein
VGRSRTVLPASPLPFGGEYLERVPNERIRCCDRCDDPKLPGVMPVTVSLRKVRCGTDIEVLQEGIPEAIAVAMCSLGRQESPGTPAIHHGFKDVDGISPAHGVPIVGRVN